MRIGPRETQDMVRTFDGVRGVAGVDGEMEPSTSLEMADSAPALEEGGRPFGFDEGVVGVLTVGGAGAELAGVDGMAGAMGFGRLPEPYFDSDRPAHN